MIFRSMRRKDELLLREYVRVILSEDDAGGNFGAGPGGDLVPGMIGPYGVSFGDKNQLAKTFITPFLDVFNTAVGKAKEITTSAKTTLKTALGAVVSTLIPSLHINYKQIFEDEKKEIEQIKNDYKEVYNRTDEALRTTDAAVLAFMAFPGEYLAANFADKAPAAAAGVLSVMTGGMSDTVIAKSLSGGKSALDFVLDRPGAKLFGGSMGGRQYSSYIRSGRLIREKSDEKIESIEKELSELLNDESFLSKLLSTGEAKEMQNRAREIYRSTLEEIVENADTLFNKTKTVDDLLKIFGKMKKIDPDIKKKLEEMNTLQGEEKDKAAAMLIDSLQKSFKEYHVKNLTDHYKSAIEAGIPEDSQYIKDYKATVSKINSM